MGSLVKKLLSVIIMFASFSSYAAIYKYTGDISQLVAKDSVLQGDDVSFVEMKNFSTAGTCLTSSGVVRAIIRDGDSGDRQYSLILSAAVSKSQIRVQVDDVYKNNEGFCYLRNVRYVF